MTTIHLTDQYQRRHLAQAVPGSYYEPAVEAWVLPDPTPRSAAVALRMFPELSLSYPELGEIRDQLAQDVRPFDNATPYNLPVTAPFVENALADEGKALFEFQSLDLGYLTNVIKEHGSAYIGWERGLGKTLGACALVESLNCSRVLVVCPNTAKESVWADEIRRWLPQAVAWVLPNNKTKRERMLGYFADDAAHVDQINVLIVHYEALALVAGKSKRGRNVNIGYGWDKLGAFDMVIADEVHRIKDASSQTAKALKKINTMYKLGLSGSIIENHAEELFSPLQWLFPLSYRAKWRDWNDRFLDFVDGPFGKLCVGVKLDQLEALRDELGVFMVYRRKSDELDLPPKTVQTLLVDLSPGQRKAYTELQQTCMTVLEDDTKIKAAEGLVMLGKLRQIATGLDLLGQISDSTKLDLAIDLITDNPDEAFVVFGWYRASCRSIAERLEAHSIESFHVDGSVDHGTRADYIARFQAGEARVFIGTLATLSESVTLHRATNAIFLDRHWNPAKNIQAEDRIYRIGQDHPVTITHIVARDTVDELRVTPTIANKEALRALIFGGT